MPVLLGRDVTDLMDMLQAGKETGNEDAFAMVTRRQARLRQKEETEREKKEEEDGAMGWMLRRERTQVRMTWKVVEKRSWRLLVVSLTLTSSWKARTDQG